MAQKSTPPAKKPPAPAKKVEEDDDDEVNAAIARALDNVDGETIVFGSGNAAQAVTSHECTEHWPNLSMPAFTHGQPVSPPTFSIPQATAHLMAQPPPSHSSHSNHLQAELFPRSARVTNVRLM